MQIPGMMKESEEIIMKKFKIAALALTAALAIGVVTGCGKTAKESETQTTVKVGLTGTIYEEIWNPIVDKFQEEGVNIELVQFSDFSLPNQALHSGDIDLNAFQHHAYFNSDVESNGYNITPIGDTIIMAMNLYSDKISDVSELKDGDTIGIPNDASNGGRALKLLESAGILTLNESAGSNPEISDIVSYNVNVELVETNAADLCALLPDVTAAVINGNYALDYGIDPNEEAIFNETEYDDDSYFCLIAARSEDADNELYQRIVKEFQSEQTKEICKDTFKGFFVPAWEK